MKKNRIQIIHSIPAKICLSILIIETVLLSLIGFYYIRNFNNQIDLALMEKMELPAVLMSLRALSFNAVTNLDAISDIIQEDVMEAYITKSDGTIFYTSDPQKSGTNYREYLTKHELMFPHQVFNAPQHIYYRGSTNNFYISTLSPLTVGKKFLGNLYIKISANQAEQKKQEILILFLGGSLLTILMTTVLEAFYLYDLFVPRIARATAVMSKVENGDFSAHVIRPGAPDQLGKLLTQINGMIKTVSQHTQTLEKINEAGEQLAQVHSFQQLFDTTSTLLSSLFDVTLQQAPLPPSDKSVTNPPHTIKESPLALSKDKTQLLLRVPADTDHTAFMHGTFSRQDGSKIDRSDEIAMLLSFKRMLKNSVRRVNAIELISLAEAKYRKLFSSTIDGIFCSTPTGQIKEANHALATMLGYASPYELIHSIKDLGQQVYAIPELRETIMHQLEKDENLTDFEVEVKRKDGSIFPCSISAQIMRDPHGEIIAIEGRLTNIEDRKLREKAERKRELAEAANKAQAELVDELESNKKKLQRSLEEKEILLREVFHRTKNNMLVIISMLRLQLHSVEDSHTKSILLDTENRIRAMALVHERLYRSDNLSEIDLGEYLAEMVNNLVSTMVLDKRISVKIKTQPVAISIDNAVPLGLAVNELVTNAIIHGFPAKRQGTISVALNQYKDKAIELKIIDDGVGLPGDFNLERLTSFGMQMTHNLLTKQLQGEYSISSKNGTMATIRFTEPERLQRIAL